MDIPEGPGLALGIVGFILSFFAVIISWASLEANKSSARAAEESGQTARHAVEYQRKEMLLARKACLALAREKNVGGFVFGHDDEHGTTLKVFVRNEGKEWAYNVQCRLTIGDKSRGNLWPLHRTIAPGAVEGIAMSFPFLMREYDYMPFDSQEYFEFRADYRDGVGSDFVLVRFRFEEAALTDPDEEGGSRAGSPLPIPKIPCVQSFADQ